MKKKTPWVAAALSLCFPVLSQAQNNPADTKSPASALRYESAFADYSPWKDLPAGDWRAANDALGAGAAHGGHNMDAPMASPEPGGSQKPAPSASSPASPPHEGHQMQMPGDQK
jgi:hypothetical protein